MGLLSKVKEQIDVEDSEGYARVTEISVGSIRLNPQKPRKQFDTTELTQLARSIAQDGVIQPLLCRRMNGYFELVFGERRLRAAKLAGLKKVPCITVQISDERSACLALIENIQRSDLSFFEEAEAICTLIKQYRMTQEETAIRLGMAQSTVANKLRILKLSDTERDFIVGNSLTERRARALLKVENKEMRWEILKKIAEGNLNVEQTEKLIRATIKTDKIKESYRKRAPILKDVRLFVNTINKAVNVMRLAGVQAASKKVQCDGYVQYIITIPDNDKG